MKFISKHAAALLLLFFVCKIAIESSGQADTSHLPKALLLSRLAANQPIPSGSFDSESVVSAIRAAQKR